MPGLEGAEYIFLDMRGRSGSSGLFNFVEDYEY
jgi:hypothetical protein